MTRRLFNLVTTLSLLACVAACALWVRSHAVLDWVTRTDVSIGADGWVDEHVNCSARGVLTLAHNQYRQGASPPELGWRVAHDRPTPWGVSWSPPTFWNRIGFGLAYWRDVEDGRLSSWGVAVSLPIWVLTVAFALAPAPRLKGLIRRRRPGLCGGCGYDLRATPDRCPECGSEPAGTRGERQGAKAPR